MKKRHSILPFIGPPLEEGPLPAFFYFALSEEESLFKKPYNQCLRPLLDQKIRIFSKSLPHHNGKNSREAFSLWKGDYEKGTDPLKPFFETFIDSFQKLQKGNVFTEKVAMGGLSRGAIVASYLTAKIKEVSHLLTFAPLISLSHIDELSSLSPLATSLMAPYDTTSLQENLFNCSIHFVMGNADEKIDSQKVASLILSLAKTAQNKGISSPPITLSVSPSIGYLGHGTSEKAFLEGGEWIKKELLL